MKIAIAIVLLCTLFVTCSGRAEEVVPAGPVVMLGQNVDFQVDLPFCFSEEGAVDSLVNIEIVPYKRWWSTYRFVTKMFNYEVCTHNWIRAHLVEVVGREYTDSEGGTWSIVKAKPIDYPHTEYIYLLLGNFEIITQEESEERDALLDALAV